MPGESLVVSPRVARAAIEFPEGMNAYTDKGSIMPPRSIWFEPKLADGIISLPLNYSIIFFFVFL